MVADARALPFRDQVFDGVAALGVLNYLAVEDMRIALWECRRVLVAGGILVVRTGTLLNRLGNMARAVYYRRKVAETNYYPARVYLGEMERVGFRTLKVFHSLDTPWQLTARTLAKYVGYLMLRALWIVARAI